jgi:hypothetical protein
MINDRAWHLATFSVTIDTTLTAIIYTREHSSALLLVHVLSPAQSRRTPLAMILMHGRWTRYRRTGHSKLRASV